MGHLGKSHLHHKPHSIGYSIVLAAILLGFCQSTQVLGKEAAAVKKLYFEENVEPPAAIGNMALPDADSNEVYTVLQASDRITNLPGNPLYSDIFDFQPNGNIVARRKLDREQKGKYNLVAVLSSGTYHTVEIIVRDLNDNAPQFPVQKKTIPVPENTRLGGQLAVLGSALDEDAGINSTQRYEIFSGSDGVFRLDETQFGNNDVSVRLKLNATLDYETQKHYTLVVRAYDGQGRYGDLTVNIDVVDVNDLVPVFANSLYRAQVFENATIGQRVLTVEATDTEEGSYGVVEYELSSEDSTVNYQHFAVDGTSGAITVQHALDFATQSVYRLRVLAKNPGSTGKSSSAVVNIQVVNINDQAPEITVDYLYSGLLSEDLATSTNIIRLSIADPDLDTGNFSVELSDMGGTFGLSRRDRDTFFIVLNGELDRETVDGYNLSVTAWDSGSPPLYTRGPSKTVAVEILIADVNDNPPEFSANSYTLEVDELIKLGSPIDNITARDKDLGKNALLTYSLVGIPGANSDWFTVHNASGMVQTAKEPIVCETGVSPRFYLRATDNGVPRLNSSLVLVIVTIRDLNNNEPVFDRSFYAAEASENVDLGSVITRVTATDSDCGPNSVVSYSLGGEGVTPPAHFAIDAQTGVITLAQKLDYESNQLLEFPVTASDKGGNSASINVKVAVKDANDNQPIFYPQTYAANVRPNSGVGDSIIVVKATDADSGAMGNVSYSITGGDGSTFFSVDSHSGTITLKRSLPSPVPDSFQLTIGAVDGLNSPALVSANVTIIVVKDSTLAPLFTLPLYQFTVPENSAQHQPVGVVQAKVQDSTAGISYAIFSGDQFGYFYIDGRSGQIKTTAIKADRERFDFVILNMRAEKDGNYGNAQVNITIQDANDNKPEFTSSQTALALPEDTEVDKTLYTIVAKDRDSGENGRVKYQLTLNTNQMFLINPTSGALSLKESLNYETKTSYNLRVEAYDSGTPRQTNTLDITISVQDINDNSPIFNQSTYDLRLSELSPPLTRFGPVSASDADSGQNGKIHYFIKENQTNFGIFPNTGKLYNEISFSPLERRQAFNLHVVAADGGSPGLSATCTVNIKIRDENDNVPTFSQSVFELEVQEGALSGRQIGSVSASDNDAEDNARLTFTLPADVKAFRINPNNGNIYVNSAIDREETPRFEFSVNVVDAGTPARSAAAVVKVTVTDINDNAPRFNNVQKEVIPAYVYENKDNSTLIVQVTAVDPDEGENQRVSYRIAGAQSKHFAIDPVSGWIRARVKFDREVQAVYNVAVVARDYGARPLSSTAIVLVKVLDKNEPPRFTASYLKLQTPENIALGTIIGKVLAQDGDQGENGRVHYTIRQSNPENVFDVNMTSGDIYSALPVDYEKISFHWLIVQAFDSSLDDQQATNINVTIKVIDKNDNVPTFDRDPKWINIVENPTIGDPIGQVTAHDKDSGQNGEFIYEIVSQYPQLPPGMFSINPKSGQISTATTIDYEITSGALLVIKAKDQAVNETERMHSTCSVVINIEDINDNYPKFTSRNHISIAEDENVGFPLLLVAATDADRNNSVRFTVTSGNEDNKFNLHRGTGELKLNEPLDRETQSTYNLTVKAIDTGIPPKHDIQTIYITVTDVNDNPPKFGNATYTASVREEQADVQQVVTVTATDPDYGANAKLSYLIPKGLADNRFTIDNHGVIRTTRPLDREVKSVYTFSAYVHDDAYPKLYDWCTVTVHVTDVNDHTPYFLHREFFQTVPENLQDRGTSIFQVVAHDGDEGDNALITYSILMGNDAKNFSIDSSTGKIYAKSLDRERQERYRIVIEAKDNGNPPRHNETTVIITISDTNDNDPEFTNHGANYRASLNETIAPGSFVLAISATDPDKGNNSKISYYISNTEENNGTDGKFHLDMDTGILRTSATGHFDREKKSFYSFLVTAQDNAQYDPRTKQTWVEITILDINDNAPKFDEFPFKKNISGHGATDRVLMLKAHDGDEPNTPNSEILYSIVGKQDYFMVEERTGEVKAKRSLVGVTGLQQFKVRARDRGSPPLSSDGYVEIRVGSTGGQQAFRFSRTSYQVALDEDAATDSLVLMLKASHTDGTVDDRIVYSMSGDVAENNNPFHIGRNDGKIRVSDSSKLNYEEVQRFRIVVIAVSGDAEANDYCTVWIHVRDKNDNAPTFPLERNQGFVLESANVSTYILQVKATDKDGTRPNKDVEYRLQGDKARYLHIGRKTGIIRLAQRVDRETNAQMKVTIIAQDKGSPSMSGSTVLRVTIQDANDNAPTFTNLAQHQANNPVLIKEGMQVGQQVFIVTALDQDTSPEVKYNFAPAGNPGQTFNIDHFSGRITLAKELDHELVSSYILNLIANDSVSAVKGDLHVKVVDENDNAPVFKESGYKISIDELMPSDKVIRVQATDRDSGLNGRIAYSLQGAGAEYFYINSTSGWIYNRGQIIYSTSKAIIDLAIKAADGGVPELNALVFVQIHINDINNYAPTFSPTQSFTESVSEFEEVGETVLSLSASDADDSPDNKRIEFSIVGGDPDGTFSMGNQEVNIGNIVLKKTLDRETKDLYQLIVMASDGGTPSRNTTAMVNITVSDFNDWKPVFSNPDLQHDPQSKIPMIVAKVAEDIAAGSKILTVQATDRDIGDNAVIEFMITSGNDNGLFQMNQQTGIISLAEGKTLDYDSKQEHRMQVRAADTGVPRQSALATVLVRVSDVNDNKPRFINMMYLENVKEKEPYGTKVFVAKAVDADAGIYGELTYTLMGVDASKFKIDPSSGQVITAIEFSYAGKRTYYFNVSATDRGGLKDFVQVQVRVLRSDQHKPVFGQSSYKFEIPDLSQTHVNMEIGRVKATDDDPETHGTVIYTLLNDSYYFNVSREEGIIAIKNPLTNEKGSAKAKRDLSRQVAHRQLVRTKRSLSSEERLSIKAWSGETGSQFSVVEVMIVIPGVGSVTAPTKQGIETMNLVIIIVVVSLAVIILVVVLLVKTMRNCRSTSKEPQSTLTHPDNMDSLGRADTYGRMIPPGMAPPPYGSYAPYGTASHDMTDRSQCASSGRGSAEFDDEGDEEITAINTVPLHVHQRAKMMPDSGIQRDTDTISEHSARDHQEYLARLGIDPKKIGGDKKGLHQSVESMHQFSDEGGGEADPLDISNLYNKLGDDGGGGGEDAEGENNINQMGFGEAPAQIGSLSSVTDASEEFTGSYNWDYLLNWGPQFQPLADVFAEIARLKDETIQPKRKPVQTIPQIGGMRTQPLLKVGGPPPIITATPPRVDSHSRGHEMTNMSSARTSQLTSMMSLPHSPVSHESSFSNLAFSPNFTPALSPLATRSPSVSTLQSNGSRSRSTQGSRSGQHMLAKPPSITTDSDAEFRI